MTIYKNISKKEFEKLMNKIFNEMRITEKWNIGYHTVLLEMCNDLINYGMHEGCTIMPNSTFQAIQQIRVLI